MVGIPFQGPLCVDFDSLGIKYFVFNKFGNKPYSFTGIIKLFFYLYNSNFDIVHAQAGIVPCIIAKIFNVKLIIEHKHGLDFSLEKRNNLGFFRKYYEKSKKYFVDYTLTGSESDRQYLINTLAYKPESVITLYNGIEKNYIIRKNWIEKRDRFIIGTIGRLAYQKAQEYFIEMAYLISQEKKDKKIVFEIWGEGEEYSRLNSLISKYHLEDEVTLNGYAYNREELYCKFDIFLLPSRYEGIPYVILEAMSAGIPIVATDIGGVNEVIKKDYNGILVPKENPQKLKEAVMKVANDDKFAHYLGDNAHNDFIRNWSIDSTLSSLEKIYSLIENS